MPTYEYACRECGHRFDVVQSIHDDALTACESCGGEVRRVVAAVGVHFKGSGFYRTDSRSGKASGTGDSGPKGGKADSAKEGGGGSAGDGSKAAGESTGKSESKGASDGSGAKAPAGGGGGSSAKSGSDGG